MKPELPCLALDDVRDRVYQKYEISYADAKLAVNYLVCFLNARRQNPDRLIILPQVADWAWHELILDTARYRALCSQLFGRFLHHTARMTSEHDRDSFAKSSEFMRNIYGLEFGDNVQEWLEAGWNNPRYRLRTPLNLQRSYRHPSSRSSLPEFLSWLPGRVSRRFNIPLEAAGNGVHEYADRFRTLGSSDLRNPFLGRSILCEIAWEEHILWTTRYEADCQTYLGQFLDHTPREVKGVDRSEEASRFVRAA